MKPNVKADPAWITDALQQHQSALTRYALRFTGDLERARDVVQDTFLQLCRQPRGRVEGHLAQWLYTVCRNKALDVRRKESRMTAFQEATELSVPTRDPSPADQVVTHDQCRQAMGVLQDLTENQQEVIRLKFQDELSYREISAVTGLSVSNVGFILHTGLKKIREKMTVPQPHAVGLRRVK